MSQNPPENVPEVASHDLLGWLHEKLEMAEKSLKAREQSAHDWKTGTDAEWNEAARLSGCKPIGKKQRLETAARDERITVKARREVEMFRAVIAALSLPNKLLSEPCQDSEKS